MVRILAVLAAIFIVLGVAGDALSGSKDRARRGCGSVNVDDFGGDPQEAFNANGFATIAGESYWLPADAQEAEFGNFVASGSDLSPYSVRNWYTSWANLETAPGVYDWASFDAFLDDQAAAEQPVQMHMRSQDLSRIPSHYHSYLTETTLPGGAGTRGVVDLWHPVVEAAFNDMIQAFGDRYRGHPGLHSTYVHLISNAAGEEFVLSPVDIAHLESTYGITWHDIDEWVKGRIDTYASAFAGMQDRIAYVGTTGDEWPWAPVAYQAMVRDLIDYAWSKGLGIRAGIVEKFNIRLYDPYGFGVTVDDEGYILIDETIPPIAEGRYFGDENEEYGDSWTWRYGPRSGDEHRYRFSMFQALQHRFNHLWEIKEGQDTNLPFAQWVEASLGHTIETTPDIWAYLRETPVSTSLSSSGVVKNFERWLVQRDVPGGQTVATEWVARDWDAGWPRGDNGDYTARRTNRLGGQDRIYFQAHEDYDVSGRLTLMVEIVDRNAGNWVVEYVDESGKVAQTEAYSGMGFGSTQTVAFWLDGYQSRGLSNGMDFAIRRTSGGDVVVKWVRLIQGVYSSP